MGKRDNLQVDKNLRVTKKISDPHIQVHMEYKIKINTVKITMQ